MKKCGCTWLIACDYHSAQYDKADCELTSLQIAQRMAKRVNNRIEKSVNDAEDALAAKLTLLSTIVFAVIIGIILFATAG